MPIMSRTVPWLAVWFIAALLAGGCNTTNSANGVVRIDNVAMYGQPRTPRPPALQKADADFIRNVTAEFGDAKRASIIWADQGERYAAEGNLDYAMRRYNQAWLLNPDNFRAFWGFGRVSLEFNRYDETIEHLERARALCDNDYQRPALLSDLATAYSFKAKEAPGLDADQRSALFGKANDYFAQSTALDPRYAGSWKRWAISLHREARFADAWAKVKHARQLGVADFSPSFLTTLAKALPEPP